MKHLLVLLSAPFVLAFLVVLALGVGLWGLVCEMTEPDSL